MTTIALPRNDKWTRLELWEEAEPVGQEGDELRAGVHAGLGLRAVAEGVAHVLRLVHVEEVGVLVPGVGVVGELLRVVAGGGGARLLHHEERQRPVLGGRALHGRAARSAIRPHDKRISVRLVARGEEPVEEVVRGGGNVDVAGEHVEVDLGAAREVIGELHRRFAHRRRAEDVLARGEGARVSLSVFRQTSLSTTSIKTIKTIKYLSRRGTAEQAKPPTSFNEKWQASRARARRE
eukprot:scaffold2708_cov158-Ochromonas_danica.AAC.19